MEDITDFDFNSLFYTARRILRKAPGCAEQDWINPINNNIKRIKNTEKSLKKIEIHLIGVSVESEKLKNYLVSKNLPPYMHHQIHSSSNVNEEDFKKIKEFLYYREEYNKILRKQIAAIEKIKNDKSKLKVLVKDLRKWIRICRENSYSHSYF